MTKRSRASYLSNHLGVKERYFYPEKNDSGRSESSRSRLLDKAKDVVKIRHYVIPQYARGD